MKLTSEEVLGELVRQPERRWWVATGVSTDSRSIEEGELFVALTGERYDGHDFVRDAFGRGAVAAIVSRHVELPPTMADRALVKVHDTLEALGKLANYYRRRWGGKVIAVTGSNGKTTTREMIYLALSGSMRVKRSPESYNNAVGVPLTIFQVEEEDQALVVEMGTNAPGEIANLAKIAQPDVGVITNVGETHLEGLGDLEGVARAKGELLAGLKEDGLAVLNADDPWGVLFAEQFKGRVITFGRSYRAMVRAVRERRTSDGFEFQLNTGQLVRLSIPGEHNVMNALAALAVTQGLGADMEAAVQKLHEFKLPKMRLTRTEIAGVLVINDAYNANIQSMRAAIRELDAIQVSGRKIMVCGDMLELGKHSARLHEELGIAIAKSHIDLLWAVGHAVEVTAIAARTHGRPNLEIHHEPSVEKAGQKVAESLRPGDVVLIKGSRAMRMERIADAIVAKLSKGTSAEA